MASLEARLSALEASLNECGEYARPLTDAERAVRLVHTLNGPDTPRRARVMKFLQATGIALQSEVAQSVSPNSTRP